MRKRRPRRSVAVLLGLTAAIGLLVAGPTGALGAPAPSSTGYQRYYLVTPSYEGKPEGLTEIADRFLGASSRSREIFDLNVGRTQPDGALLKDPTKLHAGWYLVLPWDADGAGVRYGLVPAAPSPSPGTSSTAAATAPIEAPIVNQPAANQMQSTCQATTSSSDKENSGAEENQWAARRVAPEHAWSHSRGAGVMVAVVDSGVDASLPALSGRIAVGTDIVSGSGRGDTDCLGTGTAMASIIAARADSGAGSVTGIAPDATILPVRLVTTDPAAKASDQAAAIEFADSAGARVIALGKHVSTGDPTVAAAIAAATAHNVVVVTGTDAGGANPSPGASADPAGSGNLLRVGAIGIDGKPAGQYRPGTLDVVAPGIAVAGLGISGTGQVEVTGSQYAAAFVAGEVALVRARYPHLTAAQVVHRIEATADPLGGPGPAGEFGAGLIDPGLSVTQLLPEENPSAPRAAPVIHRRIPRPFRIQALIIIAALVLATAVLLILRARRIIRPRAPEPDAVAAPATTPPGAGIAVALRDRLRRLSIPDSGPAGAAVAPTETSAPPTRQAETSQTRTEESARAARTGGSYRRHTVAVAGVVRAPDAMRKETSQ